MNVRSYCFDLLEPSRYKLQVRGGRATFNSLSLMWRELIQPLRKLLSALCHFANRCIFL
jgi:hypothetical protein